MIILLFGVSNIGKTTTGCKLAEHLGCRFYDLDDEVRKFYHVTLEEFVTSGTLSERDKKRGNVLQMIMAYPHDKVIAVSPIYYSSNFNRHITGENVLAIELQDSPLNIFDRLVFSDENDVIYKDDAYKNLHKKYYISDIKKDITYYKRSFSKIANKFQMNNDSVERVIERLIDSYGLMTLPSPESHY